MSEAGIRRVRIASDRDVFKAVKRAPRLRGWLFLDRCAGLLDGLRGLPDVQNARTTARLARIERWEGAQSGRLISYYGPLLSQWQGVHQQLAIQRDLQSQRLSNSRAALESLVDGGPEVGAVLGESELPARLVATRRRREYERAMAELRAQVVTAEGDLADTEQASLACEAMLAALDDQRDGVRLRLSALAGRRRAKYLAGVTQTHPDRAALVAAFGQPTGDGYEQLHLVTTEESA